MRSFSSSSALVRIVSIVTTTYSGCNIRDNRKKFVLCSYKWTKSATCSFNNPRCGNRGIKTLWDMCQDSSILSLSLDPFVFFLFLSYLSRALARQIFISSLRPVLSLFLSIFPLLSLTLFFFLPLSVLILYLPWSIPLSLIPLSRFSRRTRKFDTSGKQGENGENYRVYVLLNLCLM